MNTKDKILKESIILFAKNGYEGTSLTSIAQKIGIEKPSLYAHYKNKKEIFECCLEKVISNQVAFTNKILTDSTILNAEDRLYKLIKDCSKNVGESYYSFYYRFLYFPPENLQGTIKKQYDYAIIQCNSALTVAIEFGFKNKEFDMTLSEKEIITSYNCLLNGISSNYETLSQIELIWKVYWKGIKF